MANPTHVRRVRLNSSVVQTALLAVILFLGLTTTAWSQPTGIGGKRGVDFASVNLYVGAEFTPVLTLDPSDPNYVAKLLNAVGTIYGKIIASDYPKRADALARQIVERAPDILALQEVSLIRSQSPGDLLLGGTTPATHEELDFLKIFLRALELHGGHYKVAATVENTDVEAPLPVGSFPFVDLRLTDRDVILVRSDLPPGQLRTSNPRCANFTARLSLPNGIDVLRGWCSLDVQLRGRSFRVIDTHLEEALPAPIPNIQLAQAAELLAGPANTGLPVILSGDFNSDAYGNYSPATYGLLTQPPPLGAGLEDAWSVAHPNANGGLTWGHDADLSNPAVPFTLRLDLVLYRGSQFNAIGAEVVDPRIDLAAPPFWFSDHGGLFTTFAIN